MSIYDLIQVVDDALPQTQCRRCGYDDCAGYAKAIYCSNELINRCPPGGDEGIKRLVQITGKKYIPLNQECGHEQEMRYAVIDEEACIGCKLCIKVCPTDAIVGANRTLHVVLEELCSGCDLCLAACPVDCIEMVVATPGRKAWQAWSEQQALSARKRYQQKKLRDEQRKLSQNQKMNTLTKQVNCDEPTLDT